MLQALRGWWERGRKYPGEGWLETARQEAAFTPDTWNIENSPMQLLFLPCELQTAHIRADLVAGKGAKLWMGFTKQEFTLCRDRENDSALFLDEPRHPVKGEIWKILSSQMTELDKYKKNGVGCIRKWIDVQIPYTRFVPKNRTIKGQSETADMGMWAYINPSEYWKDKLDGGFRYPSIRLFKPNNPFLKPFYYYRPDEIKR